MDALGLARVALFCGVVGPLVVGVPAQGATPRTVTLLADRDDDDLDGVADGDQTVVGPAARADLVPIDPSLAGKRVEASGDGAVRFIVAERAWPMGRPLPAGALMQGVRPGLVRLTPRSGGPAVTVRVVGLDFLSASGAVLEPARARASLERTPPARADDSGGDPDAVRVRIALPAGLPDTPTALVESFGAGGLSLDTLPQLGLVQAACGAGQDALRCLVSTPVRIVVDDVDRTHALVADRSLRGEVGGAVVARVAGYGQLLRVEGPRTPAGPLSRMRLGVRPIVVRISAGGAPAIGSNDAGAVALVRAELAVASSTWGQCGITFGDVQSIEVDVVDPPPSHLISFGDDAGLPAAGGQVRVRIDGAPISVDVVAGSSLDRAALAFALGVARAGFVPIVSQNPRISPAAAGSVDVSVRRKDGTLARLDVAPGVPLSTDRALSVRIGSVDLGDGLDHFGDMDSLAGTLEERTLLKAVGDGNPRTVEIVIVPFFSGSGRIGESFIGKDSPSLGDVVLMDRAGVRARRSSLALPHELGHVLLGEPGHPDDYGVDTPTLLMDSDASDASAFGPRRLTVEQCARAVRESGPNALVPLLAPWPLRPLKVK